MAYHVWGTVNRPYYTNVMFDGKNPPTSRELGLTDGKSLVPKQDLLPKSGYSERKRKRIPDFIEQRSCQFVSQSFKDLVEELEPGVHEFFPFLLRIGFWGDHAPQSYYVMNIMTKLPCVDIDAGGVSVGRDRFGNIAYLSPEHFPYKQITLRKSDIQGLHVWRDQYLSGSFFVSDDFMKQFNDRKMKFLENEPSIEA